MTYSIRVRMAGESGNKDGLGGIAFWAKDTSNYYIADIGPEGRFSVLRRVNDRWLYPVPGRDCPHIKKGRIEWNLLAVLVRGNEATVRVNGKDVVTFKGQVPAGGGQIGVYCQSGDAVTVWEFSDLKVTK